MLQVACSIYFEGESIINSNESSKRITGLEQLESIYGKPVPTSLSKVSKVITPLYRQWISTSKFLVLSTTGTNGTDGSPRGDNEEVVRIVDPGTVWLPDWRGNNRLDSLKNIVENGQVSLMFMVNGSENVVRINGNAHLSIDDSVIAAFSKNGNSPKCVIVVTVVEVYFQCAKALMRSRLWEPDAVIGAELPTAGQFLKEADSAFDAEPYDANYGENAKKKMW